MCFVSACEGDERERTGERGSEGAEGEINIFSTVGVRTREGGSPSGAALPTQGSRDRQSSAPF